MGVLERKSKANRRLGAFQAAALAVVAIGVVVFIAATAPNVAQLLKYFPGYKKGARFNFQVKSALSRLAAKGLVVFIEKGDKRYARITESGKHMLDLETARMQIGKKKRWDRRWRLVIFDIPERRRSVRIRLRKFMASCGFERLQDSVWAYPYDCEDLIALVKAEFRIGADALYLIVEQMEHDKHLREHFHLPLNQ
ncbi:CRISPR-associated endonuclease Cas2 [Candidatus Kaiserbacteria bacterium]|nr:CRISPR-associated endonuclease Cas2 [Candidatus Kaiserbacteria bacterium]